MSKDNRVISGEFIEIVASQLDYFNQQEEGESRINQGINQTATQAIMCTERWRIRYQTDPIFRAKVSIIVAQLMQAITK